MGTMEEMFEYKIGDVVIVRSNNNEPYWIGSVLSMDANPSRGSKLPLVKRHSDDEEFMVMGLVVQATTDLVEYFKELTFKEQWNYLVMLKYGQNGRYHLLK